MSILTTDPPKGQPGAAAPILHSVEHGHAHGAHDHRGASRRALAIVLALTVGFTVVEVVGGVLEDESRELLQAFFRQRRARTADPE